MIAVIAAEDSDRALAMLTARHIPAWVLGEVKPTKDVAENEDIRVVMRGNHPRF
jgi:phosphoribosylformylglycinamidine cyclo-ligase